MENFNLQTLLQFLWSMSMNDVTVNYRCLDIDVFQFDIFNKFSSIYAQITIKQDNIQFIKYYVHSNDNEIQEDDLKIMKKIVNDIIDFSNYNSLNSNDNKK